MIKQTMIWLTSIFALVLCSTVYARDLPNDWSSTYVEQEWQGKCEVVGRGGCREGIAYYYASSEGILLYFISYDQRKMQLNVTSTKGSCVSGKLSIPGMSEIKLREYKNTCVVVGGKQFRDAENITNVNSQLDIGMFRKVNTIKIDIELSDGKKQNVEIPMQGFSEKLNVSRNPPL
tara:strand:- start:199 stop:726 length:528 start_codon:yes stop_codon:yes gene_type:complete